MFLNVVGGSRASTLSSAVSSLANTGISFTKVDEREKQAALEEEQARLKALKVNVLRPSHILRVQLLPSVASTSSWNFALCDPTFVVLSFITRMAIMTEIA